MHSTGDNLGTKALRRRTSCAHPVGGRNPRKFLPKPLVPPTRRRVELRPRRARRAGHSEATPAAGGTRATVDHPVRSGSRARPRRERSAGQGAALRSGSRGETSSEATPPVTAGGRPRVESRSPADEHGGRRCDRRVAEPRPRMRHHGAASGRPRARRRPDGRTVARTPAPPVGATWPQGGRTCCGPLDLIHRGARTMSRMPDPPSRTRATRRGVPHTFQRPRRPIASYTRNPPVAPLNRSVRRAARGPYVGGAATSARRRSRKSRSAPSVTRARAARYAVAASAGRPSRRSRSARAAGR